MQQDFDQQQQQPQLFQPTLFTSPPAKQSTTTTLHRLARLRGKIWALTLDEAQKYYELAEFTCPMGPQQRDQLNKIKHHLQRRIDKLTRREVFERAELQQKLKLQLLERELQRARTSMNCMTSSKLERVSSSVTLRELENILGAELVQGGPAVQEEGNSISMCQRPEEEQSAQGRGGDPAVVEGDNSYQDLYQNIAELVSTENTEEDYIELDEEEQEFVAKEVEKHQKHLTPRRKVYRNFIRALKCVLEKIKRILWD